MDRQGAKAGGRGAEVGRERGTKFDRGSRQGASTRGSKVVSRAGGEGGQAPVPACLGRGALGSNRWWGVARGIEPRLAQSSATRCCLEIFASVRWDGRSGWGLGEMARAASVRGPPISPLGSWGAEEGAPHPRRARTREGRPTTRGARRAVAAPPPRAERGWRKEGEAVPTTSGEVVGTP